MRIAAIYDIHGLMATSPRLRRYTRRSVRPRWTAWWSEATSFPARCHVKPIFGVTGGSVGPEGQLSVFWGALDLGALGIHFLFPRPSAGFNSFGRFSCSRTFESHVVMRLHRGSPRSRRHSKSPPERFDECARLTITYLGGSFLYGESFDQQLYPFHQPRLPPPRLESRANLSLKSSLDRPGAHAGLFTKCMQRQRIRLVGHKCLSHGKRSRIPGER
jgi:hypothetical protein